jgi:hypothetical protein
MKLDPVGMIVSGLHTALAIQKQTSHSKPLPQALPYATFARMEHL